MNDLFVPPPGSLISVNVKLGHGRNLYNATPVLPSFRCNNSSRTILGSSRTKINTRRGRRVSDGTSEETRRYGWYILCCKVGAEIALHPIAPRPSSRHSFPFQDGRMNSLNAAGLCIDLWRQSFSSSMELADISSAPPPQRDEISACY